MWLTRGREDGSRTNSLLGEYHHGNGTSPSLETGPESRKVLQASVLGRASECESRRQQFVTPVLADIDSLLFDGIIPSAHNAVLKLQRFIPTP